MGKTKGLNNVPPKQYVKLKKIYKHLSSREIKVKWARIQKANKGSLLKLKNKLVVKSGSKTNVNFPRKNDTHYKVGSEVSPRFTPTFPTYESSFQDYDNPQPSTSTWPHDTVPYKPVIRERDPLKLESPTSCYSDNKEPYRQPHILGNSSSETDFPLLLVGVITPLRQNQFPHASRGLMPPTCYHTA